MLFPLNGLHHVGAERKGCLPEIVQSLRAAQAGELFEDLGNIHADGFVAGEQTEVGIEACRARMIVAGAQMHITTQHGRAALVFFATQNEQGFGMGFIADDTVHHVGTDFFQFGGPADVGFFIKTRQQLNDHSHFFTVLGSADE